MTKATKLPDIAADTLPTDILAAIGDIVVRWGRLEWQLGNLLGIGLMLKKPAARTLIIGMEIGVICNAIRTLTHDDHWIKREKIRSDIRTLAKEVQDSSTHRNDYAHGVFGFDMDTPNSFARYLFKAAPHRIAPSFEPIDIERLRERAREAQSFVDRATDLSVRLIASRRK